MRLAHVQFVDAPGAPVVVAEVATTPREHQYGLMGRRHLPNDRGMLFSWPSDGMRSMWMKDTLIPLDMVFVDSRGVVTSIVHSAAPGSTESRKGWGRHVLEVNGGWVRAHGVKKGQRVSIR